MTDREYSAFISHPSKDAEIATELAAAIEARGLTVWIAPRDIRPGAKWAEEILRGIQSSKCFVLLLSGTANLSDNARREEDRAAHYGKLIYPVRIEDVLPSAELEYFISMHHWTDALQGLVERALDGLVAAMEGGVIWRPQQTSGMCCSSSPAQMGNSSHSIRDGFFQARYHSVSGAHFDSKRRLALRWD